MTARSFHLDELALRAGLERPLRNHRILGAAGLDEAGADEIAFARAGTAPARIAASRAGALIIPLEAPDPGRPFLRHGNPRYLFCLALGFLRDEPSPLPGRHPTAVVADSARIGPGTCIGPFAVIEDDCELGADVRIGPHAVIGAGARIGAASIIEAHAVIYGNATIGARAHVHAGAVVGGEGFGFEVEGGQVHRMPHIGGVRLGDDVEIGILSAIDRGTTGETFIGSGSKLDNQVQIGHNAVVGRHCIIAAQAGIAGSSRIGDGVVMGGKCATADHAEVGSGARLAGGTGVYDRVPEGAIYSGEPARPHRKHLREIAALGRLPELLREMRQLELRLSHLEDEAQRRHES